MKVLILGGSGMLGHKMYEVLAEDFDTWVTFRQEPITFYRYGIFDRNKIIYPVDAFNLASVKDAIEKVKPDVVINCIGIIKQIKEAKEPLISIEINSLFPHRLYKYCSAMGIEVIHISTDCVFSGKKGMYKEGNFSDAEDLYGRTKYLGEIQGKGALTVRTSIIGRELKTTNGLLEWLFSQEGRTIKGYKNVIFAGYTAIGFAKIIARCIKEFTFLEGIYHIASNPISKFDLLMKFKRALNLNIEIEPSEAERIDRSLDNTKFVQATHYQVPNWDELVEEFALKEYSKYKNWRKL